jgi:hypothetical protein
MELRSDHWSHAGYYWKCSKCGWELLIPKMTKEEKQEMREIKAELCKELKEANFLGK